MTRALGRTWRRRYTLSRLRTDTPPECSARMRRRARVLHVLKFYRPDFTGEGIFLERCSAAMSALDPAVEHDLLVTQTPAPAVPAPAWGMLPRLIYLTRRRLPAWRHELRLLRWCLFNLHRYRVVHVRTHADWYFLSYALARLFGCRLVLSATLDDSVPVLIGHYRERLRPLARRGFRLFDAFVSISPKLQAETASVMPPARCHLVENGFVFPPTDRAAGRALRARHGIPQDALVLLFVGGLCARKDPLLLVQNHAAILQAVPQCWLLLVGPELEADYVAELRRVVAAHGIANRVVFAGEVADPHPWFAAADILAFASRLEGFGMVVPEAMGHGLPVVVRTLPGVNDSFVQEGETGFLFDDDAGYRAAVLRLAADAALRGAVGARARHFVLARYDMGQVARRYLALYGLAPPDVPADAADALPPLLAGPARRAGILDARFHTPTPADPAAPPVLLVLVDAEEAFDWGKPFSRSATDVAAMRHQTAAMRLFARYGVRPTYLLDHPVAAQEEGRAPLREFLADGACDIGAQLHPWVSPPFVETVNARNSFAGNLPLAVEYEKLRRLVGTIGEAFGTPPRLYRAGRYGVGPRTAEVLLDLGFEADSSTMPRWDFSRQGGPDFSAAPVRPYWLDTGRRLLEIPNAAALVGRLARPAGGGAPALFRRAFHPAAERLGLPAGLARLGLLERIKLTPEGTSPAEAKRLLRHLRAGGQDVFVLTYHSTSLQPGNTPYVRSDGDLGRFLRWLEEVLAFFGSELGGRFATWREVRAGVLAAERRSVPQPALPAA